jgi:hypothetical protein
MPSELTPIRSRFEAVRRGATLGCVTSPVAVRHPVSPGDKIFGVGAGVGLGVGNGVGIGVGFGVGMGLGVGVGFGVGVGLNLGVGFGVGVLTGVKSLGVAMAIFTGTGLEYVPVSGVAGATRQ